MHWIQRHILKELAFAETRRYSELKPDGVEGNLFQYHARDLEKQRLISRSDDGYSLTPSGSQYVANLHTIKPSNSKQPPRVVVMIVARNEAGEYLQFRWKRHPYRGLVSLPFGRQFSGRPALETAHEQLKDKTGYEADLYYVGLVSIISEYGHLLAQVFEAAKLRGQHGSDELTGMSFWANLSSISDAEQFPGLPQVLAWFEQGSVRAGLLEFNERPSR